MAVLLTVCETFRVLQRLEIGPNKFPPLYSSPDNIVSLVWLWLPPKFAKSPSEIPRKFEQGHPMVMIVKFLTDPPGPDGQANG